VPGFWREGKRWPGGFLATDRTEARGARREARGENEYDLPRSATMEPRAIAPGTPTTGVPLAPITLV
jgi:hypothetical protein